MYAGYIDPDWPNPDGAGDSRIIIYGYKPSSTISILGATLFGIVTIAQLYQLLRYRNYYFGVPIIFGSVLETVGYVFRALSATIDPYRTVWFIVQYFFIVVGPVFFSAAIYAILSVLINRLGRHYSPCVPPKGIVIVFVTCDVIATIVQVAGAALIGVAESTRKSPITANNMLLGGLAFQVFSFFLYLLLLFTFLQRVRKEVMKDMKSSAVAYLVATFLIYLRTCFRLAETAEGVFGYLMTHEAFFGCLEFAPVVIAVYVLSIWNPGRWNVRS